ncbi:hypothetical protein ACN47E_004675 [Coniothyrium glycines]
MSSRAPPKPGKHAWHWHNFIALIQSSGDYMCDPTSHIRLNHVKFQEARARPAPPRLLQIFVTGKDTLSQEEPPPSLPVRVAGADTISRPKTMPSQQMIGVWEEREEREELLHSAAIEPKKRHRLRLSSSINSVVYHLLFNCTFKEVPAVSFQSLPYLLSTTQIY